MGGGAGLPAPLGQPRVPKGGGAESLRSRPAGFSRGLTPAHWELQEFARLRLPTLQMADQGVCERWPNPATARWGAARRPYGLRRAQSSRQKTAAQRPSPIPLPLSQASVPHSFPTSRQR